MCFSSETVIGKSLVGSYLILLGFSRRSFGFDNFVTTSTDKIFEKNSSFM